MLTPEQQNYILAHAYVPEHIVDLMTSLSGGEPFLIDDYFCCRQDDWVIFIGYPLQHDFVFDEFEAVLEKIKKEFQPGRLSLIAPELTQHFGADCAEKGSDFYYTLETQFPVIRSVVKRNLKKAAKLLSVERSPRMEDPHHALMQEFKERVKPPLRVKELLFKIPQYVNSAKTSFVLNAWDSKGKLAAFYAIDLAAKDFANYIIGCHSKKNYVLGASDLLLSDLISMSLQHNKSYIHLGLGVNSGIRRFKEKWGGKPTRRYEMCELLLKKPSLLDTILSIRNFKE